MLPPEILTLVTEFLAPNDIISLAETNQQTYTAQGALRNLFLKSPYCRLELSQWDKWQSFADSYKCDTSFEDTFKNVELPQHCNKPLPDDFKALQGDLARQWNSDWNSCDLGICGPREDDKEAIVLDLTASNSDDETTSAKLTGLPTGKPAHRPPSRRLFSSQMEIGYKFSPQAEALLEWDMSTDAVILYTMFADGVSHKLVVDEKKGTKMHHLQLINDIALVFVLDLNTQTTYYLVPGGKLTALDFGNCKVPQEGLMMFNGHFFKAVIDEKVDLLVAHISRPMGEPTTVTPGAVYEVCQDLRYPRYGLVYTNTDKNLAHVIDLQKREVSQFFGLTKDVCLVGVSNGELAVWKYTREYLDKVCGERKMESFKEIVEQLFQNNDNWEEFHKELVEAWT
ncbi:hypothetical protein CJU90_4129 [Yarrowia sp. C11]|nr:hypothetical protein CKK34_5738 [Yarrowia sp. E02]KAG5367820.1 hypothetical protein CJU90_4129 [Yarrowia sp. C11]